MDRVAVPTKVRLCAAKSHHFEYFMNRPHSLLPHYEHSMLLPGNEVPFLIFYNENKLNILLGEVKEDIK